MQIDLTPEQRSFIEYGIEQGRYQNEEEAVREALALWVDRERARAELRQSIAAGERSLDAGEGNTLTADTLGAFGERLKQRARSGLAKR
jgi:putative addiction module CopG family antidote